MTRRKGKGGGENNSKGHYWMSLYSLLAFGILRTISLFLLLYFFLLKVNSSGCSELWLKPNFLLSKHSVLLKKYHFIKLHKREVFLIISLLEKKYINSTQVWNKFELPVVNIKKEKEKKFVIIDIIVHALVVFEQNQCIGKMDFRLAILFSSYSTWYLDPS